MNDAKFNDVLNQFKNHTSFDLLEVGRFQSFKLVHQFQKRYSYQRVYLATGSEGGKKIYVKLHRNVYSKSPERFIEFVKKDFETNQFWYHKLKDFENFGSIRPIFCSEIAGAIITEAVEGVNLGSIIGKGIRYRAGASQLQELVGLAKRAGALLRAIQTFPVNAVYDYKTLIEDIDIRMRALQEMQAPGFGADTRKSILHYLSETLASIKGRGLICYLHRDFIPANTLVAGEKIIIHDFSKIFTGPGLFDLARFFHNLELLKYKPTHRNDDVVALQKAFLSGYDFQPANDGDLFIICLLRHCITHYKGLIRDSKTSLGSKLYNRWVIHMHQKNIQKIIASESPCH